LPICLFALLLLEQQQKTALGAAIFNVIATGCRWTLLSTPSKVAGVYPAVCSAICIVVLVILANKNNSSSSSEVEPYDCLDYITDCKNQTAVDGLT
jgi:hypothetical protein